jgi:hypothetical protein
MDKENDWKQVRKDAQALRDEIRLQVHLAGMDAKTTFEQLEKQADKLAQELARDTQKAWGQLVEGFKKVREQIRADIGG